ncbi:stabilin-2-like [Uloborus diversus]|uniref:stabilin-2-like n=1 Tax=Uloborus diversus TaxID=327109 RepID=UPI002409F9D6|nr:stabilin-2-like [Uloborus diversus]
MGATCTCGDHEVCSFDANGVKVCLCKEGFAKREDVCTRICDETENACKHGGVCKKEPDDGPSFCHCKTGTSGDLCSVIDVCKDNATFCDPEKEATCDYNETKEKAYCRCKSELQKFDTALRSCRSVCKDHSNCFNEGQCAADVENSENKFCRCEKGTSGDFCLGVDDCLDGSLHCGDAENVTCIWDIKMKLAKCDCRNELFYEKETQTCIDCKTCGKDYHGCKIAADDAISCLCNEGFIQHGMECKGI